MVHNSFLNLTDNKQFKFEYINAVAEWFKEFSGKMLMKLNRFICCKPHYARPREKIIWCYLRTTILLCFAVGTVHRGLDGKFHRRMNKTKVPTTLELIWNIINCILIAPLLPNSVDDRDKFRLNDQNQNRCAIKGARN